MPCCQFSAVPASGPRPSRMSHPCTNGHPAAPKAAGRHPALMRPLVQAHFSGDGRWEVGKLSNQVSSLRNIGIYIYIGDAMNRVRALEITVQSTL